MTAVPWATVKDVTDVTGVVVTETDRTVAVHSLETVIGLIEDIERPDIKGRDRHWLKLAVAYQAAFVKDNPDLFSGLDVTSASQDGQSVTFRNQDSHLLAPLARKAIRRLSWRGLTRPGDRARGTTRVDVLSEEYEDTLPWRPV